ncbi:MAG TPA: hypothetical protein VGE76_01135 [Opitutaceae bacterium]
MTAARRLSRARWLVLCLAAAPLLLQTACTTTGDPNVDTIFWSKKKAQARLDAAGRVVEETQQKETAARDERARLRTEERRNLEQRDRLQLELAILRSEMRQLDERIQETPAPKEKEVETLRASLARLHRVSDDLAKSAIDRDTQSAAALADLAKQIADARKRIDLILPPAATP